MKSLTSASARSTTGLRNGAATTAARRLTRIAWARTVARAAGGTCSSTSTLQTRSNCPAGKGRASPRAQRYPGSRLRARSTVIDGASGRNSAIGRRGRNQKSRWWPPTSRTRGAGVRPIARAMAVVIA